MLVLRAKEIDWTPFITQKLVDELASHVKLYRRADQKLHEESSGNSTHIEGENQTMSGSVPPFTFLYKLLSHVLLCCF